MLASVYVGVLTLLGWTDRVAESHKCIYTYRQTMSRTYEIVKEAYEKEFSDDPMLAVDPLFYMLERLFFKFSEEPRRENVEKFIDTFSGIQSRDWIATLLHYCVTQTILNT